MSFIYEINARFLHKKTNLTHTCVGLILLKLFFSFYYCLQPFLIKVFVWLIGCCLGLFGASESEHLPCKVHIFCKYLILISIQRGNFLNHMKGGCPVPIDFYQAPGV